MIPFLLLATLVIVLVIACLAWPLVRRPGRERQSADEADLAAYRDRLAELEEDHARGTLSKEELQAAIDELERELLQARDTTGSDRTAANRAPARVTALLVALLVPLGGAVLYGVAGHPDLLYPGDRGELTRERVQEINAMPAEARIGTLENWVADHADSARGWSLLAQAYRETEAYGDAASAFARARAAGANDAWLIARQAEALLLANNRRFTRGVQRLLEEALDRDARNPLALMLSGQAAMVGGDPGTAADYWRRLAETLPDDAEQRNLIEQLVARAEAAASGTGDTGDTGAEQPVAEGGTARIEVTVSLANGMADAVEPDDTVFVFARHADGDGPPLAVVRTRVEELPRRLVLDDGDAMSPQARLSGAEEVTITARVSRSGQAMPQSGDLEGRTEPVTLDGRTAVEVVIDRRLP